MAAEHTTGKESDTSRITIVWNVNLLCIVGACIGVAALFLGWIYQPPSMPTHLGIRNYPTVLYMIVNQYMYYGAAALFLLGTVIAFVSPIGGIPQLASLMAFAYGMVASGYDPRLDGIDPQQKIWFGMGLGVVSCILILTSLFTPWGPGNMHPPRSKNIRFRERLLTVTLSIGSQKGA
jgi:hypothetical protein